MALEDDAQQAGTELTSSCQAEASAIAQKISASTPDVSPQIEAIKKVTGPLIESNLDKTAKAKVEQGFEQRKDLDMEGPGPETLEM